ncbi:TetR/AcrR family transcriptional regulator [Paenibacillus sinopodophylli]|uniref:TetR/AcrR family transcriptional regulator n=1 Tax=Paenibacillus sinopodophylli TaxID=1837342 RepID=UPI0014875EEE|nr:TetR family transcriptional regulator [Paenibacillus sinopodophylli]
MTTGDTDIKVRILLAAKKLFAKHGFEKTTVRQICEEAGANVALVSYHFGGKENMFGALFEQFFPNDQISKVNPHLSPLDGVKLIVSEVTKFRYRDPQLIGIIQQEIIMNTERIQKIREHVMPMWRLLRNWLRQGEEQGIFQFRSLDTAFMSIVGTLLFHRHTEYWAIMLDEGKPELDQMIEDLSIFILAGLQYKLK